jgi:hypothetical protein
MRTLFLLVTGAVTFASAAYAGPSREDMMAADKAIAEMKRDGQIPAMTTMGGMSVQLFDYRRIDDMLVVYLHTNTAKVPAGTTELMSRDICGDSDFVDMMKAGFKLGYVVSGLNNQKLTEDVITLNRCK